jgi:hypothetical protein
MQEPPAPSSTQPPPIPRLHMAYTNDASPPRAFGVVPMKVRKASVVGPHTVEAKDDAPASDPPLHTQHIIQTQRGMRGGAETVRTLDCDREGPFSLSECPFCVNQRGAVPGVCVFDGVQRGLESRQERHPRLTHTTHQHTHLHTDNNHTHTKHTHTSGQDTRLISHPTPRRLNITNITNMLLSSS